MKAVVIIPARYASSRFPGKPLAMLGGKPMVQHVYERAASAEGVDGVFVATDDVRIASCVESFAGAGRAVMTSERHNSGTDRCGEVVQKLKEQGLEYDVVINLQGDEPFVKPVDITSLAAAFEDNDVQIATLRKCITDADDLMSPNCVKVVCGNGGRALYFSRLPIPFMRDIDQCQWETKGLHYKHVGIYAFRTQVLLDVCQLEQSPLEKSEKLEQLRWLEAGYHITVNDTDYTGLGIDTPADLERAEEKIK